MDLPELKGARVCVRALRDADARLLARHANNPAVADQLRDLFPQPYGVEDARQFIRWVSNDERSHVFALDVGGDACGSIGLFPQEDINRVSAELGYWLGQDYWGQGLMSEAIALTVDWAFSALSLRRIFATPFSHNTASCRVLEKCGFQREGLMGKAALKKGELLDQVLYARTQ